jgi:beta-lactamase class A
VRSAIYTGLYFIGLSASLLLLHPVESVTAHRATATQAGLTSARAEIARLIAESGAEAVSVAVDDLKTGERLVIDEHQIFHAASMMKVPVMMEIYRLAGHDKLKLSETIQIKNRFASIVDGSQYQLNAEDDSEIELYKKVGTQVSIAELVELMITRSSNLATNLLIERFGAEAATKVVRTLGGQEMTVRRGVEDGKAFRAGLNNVTSAYDLMLLFKALAEKKFLGAHMSEEMIGVLHRQKFNEAIPAGLPAGTRVAHKTGSITRIKHDGGIVFIPGRKPYVIIVLTRGIADEQKSNELIAKISGTVYRELTRAK